MISFDRDWLVAELGRNGLEAEFREDAEYPVVMRWPNGQEGQTGISHHFLMRIGLEFFSLRWIAATEVDLVKGFIEAQRDPDATWQMPIPEGFRLP